MLRPLATFTLICAAAGAFVSVASAQESVPQPVESEPKTTPVEPGAFTPEPWRRVFDAAIASGDKARIKAVVQTLKETYPQDADRIQAAVPVPPPPPEYGFFNPKGWDGEGELSGSVARGNSENTAFGAAFLARNEIGRYLNTFSAYIDIGGSDGERSQERFGGLYSLDITVTDQSYAYQKLEYEDDRFSGFEYRLFYTVGAGLHVFNTDPFKWKLEMGPGVRYSKLQQTTDADATSPTFGMQIPIENESTDFAAFALSEIDWKITDATTLKHTLNTTYTDPTTTVESRVAVDTKLNGSLSMRTSVRVRYETDPPSGQEKTDTVLKAALLFSY